MACANDAVRWNRPIPLDDQHFQDTLSRQSLVVALEFWSFRCEACRRTAAVVSRMAEMFAGRLRVFKVNVDACPRLVSEFAVPYVPYLLILKGGRPVASFDDRWEPEQIESLLD